MPMNTPENPVERLKPLIHCPVCQKKYDPARVTLLSEDDRNTVLHLDCRECGASSLVFVSIGAMGVVSLGMLTDLDSDEARHFHGQQPVSADDALSLHRFLSDFSGGVEECLPKGGRRGL